MTIEYIKKDLTTVNHGVVAHGCNCQGKMGAGVAKDIRNKWPAAYYEYVDLVGSMRNNQRGQLLGRCQLVEVEQTEISRVYVANCFTQEYYGREVGRRYADPNAIRHALANALTLCSARELPLYMSRIGCSLGGLDWMDDVFPIVTELDIKLKQRVPIWVCDK